MNVCGCDFVSAKGKEYESGGRRRCFHRCMGIRMRHLSGKQESYNRENCMAGALEREDRKSQILEAARRCLSRYGFEKMTMDDVGREVGLNKASLYYYYKNKDAIVTDVLTSEASQYIDALRAKVESVDGCSKRIQIYLVERFRISQRVVNLHNMSLRNFRQIRPLFRELHKKFRAEEVAFIGHILNYCITEGDFVKCDVDRVAKSIWAVAEAYKSEVIDNPETSPDAPVDYTAIENDLVYTVSLIVNGLRKPQIG